jgi:hypothetical protein
VLIQIWSGGAVDRLYQALPILFMWEIVGLPMGVVALGFRCRVAEREFRAMEEERRQLILKAEKGKVDVVEEEVPSLVDGKAGGFEVDGERNV